MSLGFVFPGQGAQEVGMVGDVAAVEPAAAARFEEASDALGLDLAGVVRDGPLERLNSTEITQPALLLASVALFDAWTARGGSRPTVVAGHSLGEYSALAVAGTLDFGAAVRLVHERGKLMQQAVPAGEGAMAAILGLDDDAVAACCAEVDGVVAPANYNSPGQVVVAGAADAVGRAADACKSQGARRTVLLDVSVPSHCVLMAPAADELAALLDAVELGDPTIPVVQNFSAAAATDVATIRANLLRQLVSPVRWAESVRTMAEGGARAFIECGPGNVLAGLARRIDRSLTFHGAGTLDGLERALAAVTE